MNTDGNLAALRQYERGQDEAESADLKIEVMQQDLAIDLFEGYVTENHCVIDEINDCMAINDLEEVMMEPMRRAMIEECKRPKMGRGCLLYSAYEKVVDAVCRDIAGRYATEGDIDEAREEFGI